jgi:hypothetical protein
MQSLASVMSAGGESEGDVAPSSSAPRSPASTPPATTAALPARIALHCRAPSPPATAPPRVLALPSIGIGPTCVCVRVEGVPIPTGGDDRLSRHEHSCISALDWQRGSVLFDPR